MAKGSKNRRRRRKRNPAANFTDDIIVEILSRLPIKSLCRCKCVSSRWRDLISDPGHRKRLPQTLAGLFYATENYARFPVQALHFTNIWEWERRRPSPPPLILPSLFFIPGYEHISIVNSCNGLLLCRRPESTSFNAFGYVVCNPATESWVALPGSSSGGKLRVAWLGFDPAVSSHFHVFEFVDKFHGLGVVAGVEIYSSQTGIWSYKETRWNFDVSILGDESSVFYNGLLHIVVVQRAVVAVDLEGETWWMVRSPEDVNPMFGWDPGFVGRYQGRLCYINQGNASHLSIWVLADYATEWTLKHRVSIQRLTEKIITPPRNYNVITVHPDCNWILYAAGWDQTLMAYNVDREEVHVIRNLGSDSLVSSYNPYILLYSGSLTGGQ